MAYSATELRRQIYRILDEVLESGEPVEIERRGRKLRIVRAEAPARRKLSPEAPFPDLLVGDPGDFEHIDWSGEWKP